MAPEPPNNNNSSISVYVQFVDVEGTPLKSLIQLPVQATPADLNVLINKLLENRREEDLDNDDNDGEGEGKGMIQPYSFYSNDENQIELRESLEKLLEESLALCHHHKQQKEDMPAMITSENIVQLVYQPQSVYRVKPVTRCTSSLHGHGQPVLSAKFSADGTRLASGSGDCTVRFWDLNTETPRWTGKAHKDWVLAIAWSPVGSVLASGGKDGLVQLWQGDKGTPIGAPMQGHRQWITALAWEPLHLNPTPRLASASKDGTVRIWDTVRRQCILVLSQHTDAVSCLAWSSNGILFTGSRDRSIKAWNMNEKAVVSGKSFGACLYTLKGHAHWVNSLTLSNDFLLRCGSFDPASKSDAADRKDVGAHERAKENYEKSAVPHDRLVSASDDFTLFLWDLSALDPNQPSSLKPIARMTGHQALVNHVSYSPDGRFIASASFDKSIKIWNGHNGLFIGTLRGHVGPVYQLSWSSDSRQLLSGSKDTTMKIWNVKTCKLKLDLPGHLDEVYAVDWSPLGDKVVSGGKDKVLKMQVPRSFYSIINTVSVCV